MFDKIDLTAWEYGGDVTCPECQDNTLYFGVQPVWATDQCELYEVMCPVCGVIALDGDILDNDEMDRMQHDIQSYIKYRFGELPPYEEMTIFVCA